MKFRKKPVVIDAFQWILTPNGHLFWPDWFRTAVNSGIAIVQMDGSVEIKTLEGNHRGDANDWIIQGVKGEIYPCKPDIFDITYEPEVVIPQSDELRSQLAQTREQLAQARKERDSYRDCAEHLAAVLQELREVLRAEPTMQGRRFVQLGIAVNRALESSEKVGALRAKQEADALRPAKVSAEDTVPFQGGHE